MSHEEQFTAGDVGATGPGWDKDTKFTATTGDVSPDKQTYSIVMTDEMRQRMVVSKLGLEVMVAKLREENERLRAGLDATDGATVVGPLRISHRLNKPWYVYDSRRGNVEYHGVRDGDLKPFGTASEAYLYACDLLAKEEENEPTANP